MSVNINGRYLSNLRFAENILLLLESVDELQILNDLNKEKSQSRFKKSTKV